MARWNPQRYQDEGEKQGIDPGVLDAASKAIANIQAVNPSLPPILTLMHLSKVTEVNYPYLREIVGRKIDPYKSFALRKRTPGLHRTRTIHVPEDYLLTVQRWISRAILRQAAPHSASFGYHPGSSPVTAARRHRNAKWLIKIDLKDFFDNIREPAVFDVFRSLGYGSLISFEMARIVTRAPDAKRAQIAIDEHRIPFYSVDSNGFLPQGAPTSPMLSNLVMRGLDAKLQELANEHDFRYSRYADDLVFSCRDQKSRSAAQALRDAALQALRAGGFTPNMRKTTIVAPGGRKIVLGLLVDGTQIRLPREFKDNLRLHLHYLSSPTHGPAKHAKARKTSIASVYAHVRGLISWAKDTEPAYHASCMRQFGAIAWPPEVVDMVASGWDE